MKTQTFEVELDDGRLFDVDVERPSTIIEHATNFTFGGFTGMGGDVKFGDLKQVNENVFMGHPVFGSAQVSAVNDFATNIAETAATSLEMWSAGQMNYSPVMADGHMIANKLGWADDINDYAKEMKKYVQDNFSNFKMTNDSKVDGAIYDLVQGEMSLLASIGLSTFGGPVGTVLSSSLFGMIQKADTWNKAIDKGMTEAEAGRISDLTLLTEAGLEFAGLQVWGNALKGTKTFARTISKIASEALQEGSQTAASAGVEKIFGVDDMSGQAILKEVAYSALLGAIVAAPVSYVHTSMENKGIIGDMRRVGFTDAQIDNIVKKTHAIGAGELKALLAEQFPEETARILERSKQEAVVGYDVPKIESYENVENISDVVVKEKDAQEFDVPAVVEELKAIQEKENTYLSEGKKVPDSLAKRKQAILDSLGGVTEGTKLTKKQVKDITARQKEVKKYTESQALKISLGRMQTATNVAFRAGKKNIDSIKAEIIDAVRLLPKRVQGDFLVTIKNAKTQTDVNNAMDRIIKKEEVVYKQEAIKHLQKTIDRFVESPSLTVTTRDTIRRISDALDFTKITDEKKQKLQELLNDAELRHSKGEDVGLSRELYRSMLRLNATYAGDLNVREVEAIVRDIETLARAGRDGLKSSIELRTQYIQEATKDLALEVQPIVKKEISEKTKDEKSLAQATKDSLDKLINFTQSWDIATQPMPFFFDRLDGGADYNGAHSRLIYKPVNEQFSKYLVIRESWMNDVLNVVKENNFTKEQLDRVGLHAIMQQEGGMDIAEKMITDEKISKEFFESARKLSEQENKLYTEIRKSFDNMFPYIKNTMAEVYNKPVGYTKNYFTFSVDFSQIERLDIQDMFSPDFLSSPSKNYIPPFSEARTKAKVPVKLNALDIYTNYADRAAYLVTVGAVVPQISDMINNETYASAAGSYTQKLVADWISLVARKGSDQYAKAMNPFQHKVLSTLRTATANMVMGYKITSAIIQPTAIFNGAAYIGHYAFAGMTELMEENSRRFILEAMPKLKNRIGDDVSFYEFNKGVIGEYGMYVLKHLDGITAAGVSLGAMMKYAAENNTTIYALEGKKLDDAIAYAEGILTKSQSSPYFVDAAPMVTNHGILGKMFSQFQSFSYTTWNSIRHHAYQYGIKGDDYALFANMLLMTLIGIIAPSVIRKGYTAILDAVTDYDNKYDDNFILESMAQMAGTIPMMAPVVSMTQYGSIPVPSVNMIGRIADIAKTKNGAKKVARLTTYLLGFAGAPSAQIDEFIRRA